MTTIESKEWTTKDQMLPTPTAMDSSTKGLRINEETSGSSQKGENKISKSERSSKSQKQWNLFNKLQKHQTLPTPSAMEHKATAKNWNHQSGNMLSSIARRGELSPPTGKDMFLNPAFVEEMMGYPIGWLV